MRKQLYTEHKLTDQQLVRLSQIVNKRQRLYGMSLVALERKGLVESRENKFFATDSGVKALEIARNQGW